MAGQRSQKRNFALHGRAFQWIEEATNPLLPSRVFPPSQWGVTQSHHARVAVGRQFRSNPPRNDGAASGSSPGCLSLPLPLSCRSIVTLVLSSLRRVLRASCELRVSPFIICVAPSRSRPFVVQSQCFSYARVAFPPFRRFLDRLLSHTELHCQSDLRTVCFATYRTCRSELWQRAVRLIRNRSIRSLVRGPRVCLHHI